MNALEQRIIKDGIVKEGNVLKVDSFLNHQMDIELFEEMAREYQQRFAGKKVTKILTIEASGIGIAAIVAQKFGVPVVFAKKSESINLDGEIYTAQVESFTHKCKNQIIVSKKFLKPEDSVLIVDVHYRGSFRLYNRRAGVLLALALRLRRGFSKAVE